MWPGGGRWGQATNWRKLLTGDTLTKDTGTRHARASVWRFGGMLPIHVGTLPEVSGGASAALSASAGLLS